MLQVLLCLLALTCGAIAYYAVYLVGKRKQLRGLPQPPMKNNLLGHLHIADELSKIFPPGVHPQCWADYMRRKYDLPEVFYVDWRPFVGVFIFCADPELTAQYITTAQSLPKSPFETDSMNLMLGESNMISIEGSHWKSLRSMFNPGFSATNVMSMADSIVDAGMVFVDKLKSLADSNENFQLEEYATRLTMDIIGKVSLDVDLNCQKSVHPIAELFRERVALLPADGSTFPWQNPVPFRSLRLWWNGRLLNKKVNDAVDSKILQRAQDYAKGTINNKKRSVLDLALSAYEKEMSLSNIRGEKEGFEAYRISKPSQLPANIRADIVASTNTFFFAGHDTSSSLISYMLYILHRNPDKKAKLQQELNNAFPPGTDTAAAIRKNPFILNSLEYLTACIKETLRIFAPGSTVRFLNSSHSVAHRSIIDPKTSAKYPLDIPGSLIWPVAHMHHRNERFFPKPTQFIPERFIQLQTPFPDAELFTPAGKEAYRAFERGPRNCIGQELAMFETRVIIALTAREFDFVLEYPGEKPDPQHEIPDSMAEELSEASDYGRAVSSGKQKPDRVEGHRVYQTIKGTAKPIGGCPGRIYLTKQ